MFPAQLRGTRVSFSDSCSHIGVQGCATRKNGVLDTYINDNLSQPMSARANNLRRVAMSIQQTINRLKEPATSASEITFSLCHFSISQRDNLCHAPIWDPETWMRQQMRITKGSV